MQQITIHGNVGKDAELKTLQGGETVASFSLAVSQGYGENKKTIWYNVSVWGKQATTAANYVKKGCQLTVIGKLSFRENDGKEYKEVNATDFTLPARQAPAATPPVDAGSASNALPF